MPRKTTHPPPRSPDADVPARFTVIQDTRERAGKGWVFPASTLCAGTVRRKLDTGDYSLEGFEHIFTVDRKGSVSEFAKNLFEPRFERELERMRSMKMAVVLLEFEFQDLWRWPAGSGIPRAKQRYLRITRHSLLARFWQLKMKYPFVDFLFAGDCGKEATSSLFKRIIEQHGPGTRDVAGAPGADAG